MISGLWCFGYSADLDSNSKYSPQPFCSVDLGIVFVWNGLSRSVQVEVSTQQLGKQRLGGFPGMQRGC